MSQNIIEAGEKYVFDEKRRASVSVLLFGNGMTDQLTEDNICDEDNSFFPYKDVSRVHVMQSIDELREKKMKLKPVY